MAIGPRRTTVEGKRGLELDVMVGTWESIINTALNNSFKFNIALKSFRQGLSKGLSNFAQLSDHYIWARGTKFEFSILSFNPHWLVTFSLSVPVSLQWMAANKVGRNPFYIKLSSLRVPVLLCWASHSLLQPIQSGTSTLEPYANL